MTTAISCGILQELLQKSKTHHDNRRLNNTHNPENFEEKDSRNETKEETSNKETNAGRQNERIKQRV